MEVFKNTQQIENGIISASRKNITGNHREHSHEYFEIEYIIGGTGEYIIDDTTYPIRKNMLFFMSPANFHAIKMSDAEIINVMFPCNLCDADTLFRCVTAGVSPALLLSDSDSILMEKMLMEIIAASVQGNYSYAIQFLQCVLCKISVLLPKNENHSASSYIRSAIIYILGNFRTGVTLESAANHVGLAAAYLSTLFLKETGMNFKTYLDNLRFDYAVRLLNFTNMTVSEICVQSGFCDYANFVRRFKKKYGTSPISYRMMHQKNI